MSIMNISLGSNAHQNAARENDHRTAQAEAGTDEKSANTSTKFRPY